jgi:hypothetical protein
VGVLRVTAAENHVRWTVRSDEPIAFVEIHSEQAQRMLLLNIAPVTEGGVLQRSRLALTHDRRLEAVLDFSGTHPAIAVEYVDPLLTGGETEPATETSAGAVDVPAECPEMETAVEADRIPSLWSRLRGMWRRPTRLVPATVVLIALVGTGWWLLGRSTGEPTAAAVIANAVAAEMRASLPTDQAGHRTLRFLMRRAESDVAETEHQIDTWMLGGSPQRAVRVLDAAGHVVAGQWTDASGQSTTLHLGAWDEMWQAGLSATAFRDRYGAMSCTTSRNAETYTVVCDRPTSVSVLPFFYSTVHAQAATIRPTRATLLVRRADFHPIRLELHVNEGSVPRVVTLEERMLERIPITEVPAGVLAPPAVSTPTASAVTAPRRTPSAVTPSLEMRVLDLVDRLPGTDYLTVERGAAGRLAVAGLVADPRQRQSLERALAALDAGGAIVSDVDTFAEATARGERRPSPDVTRVEIWQGRAGRAPVEAYLQTRVAPGTDATALAQSLAPQLLSAARRVRSHVVILDTLLERFPEETLGTFDDQGHAAWRAFVERRLHECLDSLDTLDAALAPYFDASSAPVAFGNEPLTGAVRRLAQEALTIEDAIVAAFSTGVAPSDTSNGAAILDVREHVKRAQNTVRAASRQIQP